MIRILAAAALLVAATAPAFACNYNKSVSNEPSTVASQPAADHATPTNGKAAPEHRPS